MEEAETLTKVLTFRDIRRYHCDYCGICRSKRSLIASHLLTHHKDEMTEANGVEREKFNICKECGLSFKKPAYLKQHMQSHSLEDLHSTLKEMIPEQQRLKELKKEHGKVELGNITVDMVLGGMRGMTWLLWETSLLDPDEGIRFRGMSILEFQKVLPAAKPGGEPLPVGLLWLLLTGKVPTKEQVDGLSSELRSHAKVPS